MFLLKILFLTCFVTLCNTQSYSQAYRYPAQRRAGYSYTPTSYNSAAASYNKANPYFSSSSSYPNKPYYPSNTPYRYPSQSSSSTVKGYPSSSGSNRYPTPSSSSTSAQSYGSSSNANKYGTQSSSNGVRAYSASPSSSSSSSKRYPSQTSNNNVRGYSYSPSSSSSSSNRYSTQSSSNADRSYSSNRYPSQSSSNTVRLSNSNRYAAQTSNTFPRGSSATPYSSDSTVRASSAQTSKDYLTNSYNDVTKVRATSSSKNSPNRQDLKDKQQASKTDAENAKFLGVNNQEDIDDDESESSRTALHFKRKKLLRRRLAAASAAGYNNRCFPYGRDAAAGKSANVKSAPKEQGRFLFDVNVYNVYPQSAVGLDNGCGGYGVGYGGGFGGAGGFGGGGGVFGDNIGGAGLLGGPLSDPLYPAAPGINTFLGQWAPGILQNSLAVTARPLADPLPASAQDEDLQHDPDVDPDYRPVPIRRPRPPNQVYFDSAGAAPITPGQLVGGVATTVNGIIQQLTGNVQPVYQAPYRDPNQYDDDQQNEPIRRRKPNRVYYDSAGAAPVTPAQLIGGTAQTVNGIIQQLTGNVQPVYQSYRRSASYG